MLATQLGDLLAAVSVGQKHAICCTCVSGKYVHTCMPPSLQCGCAASANPHGAQVGVAVMRKMALQGRSQEQAAEDFATALFNQWGPGLAACRNGAILLLSIEDRQVTTLPGALASCGAC